MSPDEIRTFVGDFTEALVKLALKRVTQVDIETQAFEKRFDEIAGELDWSDPALLAQAGIEQDWVSGHEAPHRTLMHPAFVTSPARWVFVQEYLRISMVSEKLRRVLFPNLVRRRRPRVEDDVLLAEATLLNHYLHLVQESGLTGDRIIAYAGDLRTHGQGQNDSGRIGALGATVAIRDALEEIQPGVITDVAGALPPKGPNTPADLVELLADADYQAPRALLLVSHRAIIFGSDPDVAIIARIGGGGTYGSAEDAYDEWQANRLRPAEERQAIMHQSALGEVKTALDVSNMHERLALGSRETRHEVHALRFLMMAIITADIVDPEREGRRAMYSREAQRFQSVFNLYYVWGYDGARSDHPEHWADFKSQLASWCGLPVKG
ncbi:hypothetical protein [Mycolicibacterium smegmatis]|uniref:hypothetical protein n=1 Tax=Mycolicibacterium smegmatis TaxID=1772 RepID=UPI001303948B|nr:hypothetical protein [Mycolicibacterium smegmatis]